jgi:hypothetical protein
MVVDEKVIGIGTDILPGDGYVFKKDPVDTVAIVATFEPDAFGARPPDLFISDPAFFRQYLPVCGMRRWMIYGHLHLDFSFKIKIALACPASPAGFGSVQVNGFTIQQNRKII